MTIKTKLASFALAAVLGIGALAPLTATAKADGWRYGGYGGSAYSQRHGNKRFARGHNYNPHVGRRDHRRNRFGVMRRLRHSFRDMRRSYSARRHANRGRFYRNNGLRHGYNSRRHSY